MQRRTIVWLAALACASTLALQGQSVQIKERSANHRLWESVSQQWDEAGQLVSRTNRVTELGNGLHYWDEGEWKETEEVIELLNDGAAALKGPHKVIFSPNINTAGAVDLEAVNGQRFQSQIFGLSYLDTSTGQSVLIAELKDSFGELVASNQVIYPDAFTDFEADVRFTYTKEGFEQDVILRQNPPSPESYGLNPATTHLQVLTEFFNPPQPVNRLDDEGKEVIEREYISGNLLDEKLDFGGMVMGNGKAFDLEDEGVVGLPSHRGVGHPVGKQWDELEGRNFLIESVEYPRLAPELEQLPTAPPVEEARLLQTGQKLVDIVRARTDRMEAKVGGSIKQLAQVTPRKGVVVDYVLLNTVANHTFQNDKTYYVGGTVTLSGWTIVEGGTVIKYTNNAQVKIQGWIDCRTGPYRPAIFTSKDDNSVGDTIPGSTGNPYTNYYANAALYLDDKASELHHLRIAHAKEAIYYDNDSGDPSRLRHVQITHCQRGVQPRATPLFVQNVLMHNVLTNFYNATYSVTVHGEHLTINTANRLNAATGTITLNLTNSLFIGVSNFGAMAGAYNYTNSSATGVLEAMGAGANYLVSGSSLRNAGTTEITPRLKKDLGRMTTVAPILWTNSVTTATTISPQAQRDADIPDIGYHYAPLDYVASNVTVSAQLVLTNGVAIGTTGSSSSKAFYVQNTFISEGRADSLNWISRYNTVQEQADTTWSSPSAATTFTSDSNNRTIELRSTANSFSGSQGYHFFLGETQLRLRDAQFFGGQVELITPTAGITNCLWVGVSSYIDDYFEDCDFAMVNSTFVNGTLSTLKEGGGTWDFKENAFVKTAADMLGYLNQTNNLFAGYGDPFPYEGYGNIEAGELPFLRGPLGDYYHRFTTGSNLGSVTAASRGLYHHTVRMDQTKEGSGTVDIGFHYPSVSLTNLALAKIASQSSDYSGSHTATNGVNASRLGSFAHTLSGDTNAWWQVDLGTTNFIDSVWIWNRTDSFSNRLSNFYLYVSDSNFASNDPTTTKATSGVLTYFNGPASPYPGYYDVRHPGRYVRIQQNAVAPMNIYELEVYTALYPVDTDGDGVPDYIEDRNGDGSATGDGTSWQSYNSANGLSGASSFHIFNPLK